MSFAALALCLSLIAFTLGATAGSGVAAALHGALPTALDPLPARLRASCYLALRLAPTATGLLFATAFVLPAFLLFEPTESGERVSPAFLALTLVAALPLFRSIRVALAARRVTRARLAAWLAGAEPLNMDQTTGCPSYVVRAPFPVVAVVGIRRPFLVVSRAVIDTCSHEELAAVLAHEATHLRRRDNLKRLLMLATPDLLARTSAARSMELKWQQAAEEIADDGAGGDRSVHLASALVKVARLTQGLPAPPVTMAAFCRGDDIARRVGRLTGPRVAGERSARGLVVLAGMAIVGAISLTLSFGALEQVHAITEMVVGLLQ